MQQTYALMYKTSLFKKISLEFAGATRHHYKLNHMYLASIFAAGSSSSFYFFFFQFFENHLEAMHILILMSHPTYRPQQIYYCAVVCKTQYKPVT